MILNADQLCSELEKSEGDRLAAQQNKSTTLQGQIDLIRTHQAFQDQRINFAFAGEAEEADARANERWVDFLSFCLLFVYPLFFVFCKVCIFLSFLR